MVSSAGLLIWYDVLHSRLKLQLTDWLYFIDFLGEVVEWSTQISLTREMTLIYQKICHNVDKKKKEKKTAGVAKINSNKRYRKLECVTH